MTKTKKKNTMNRTMKRKGTKRKGTKRKMTSWNAFVKKVYEREKKNGKSFKECLQIAAKEKKQGKMD